MKTLKIVKSQEYHANQPSIFTLLDNIYVGCTMYPTNRNNPNIEYWSNATSSDSDRGFFVEEKEFTDDEIDIIITLNNLVSLLSKLIPDQPTFPHPSYALRTSFKIKKGKNYEAFLKAKAACDLEISNYFDSVRIYDSALTKAKSDLRKLLNK